jgi:hypothetical protein
LGVQALANFTFVLDGSVLNGSAPITAPPLTEALHLEAGLVQASALATIFAAINASLDVAGALAEPGCIAAAVLNASMRALQLNASLSALTTTLIGTPRAGEIEDEIAVRLEALERASLELEEQREELERAAQAAERREARRAETADLRAQERADLQSVLEGQEPPGPAVVRLARERTTALEALLPAQRRAAELEEDLEEAYQQIERLRVRNAALLDRERKRRGVG